MSDETKDGKKILIIEEVEDDTNLREALHDKLAREGFIVLDAKNGEEGLEVALSRQPDLILLDILMPKMGGLEMLRKLREDPVGKNIPVIIFSNFGDNEKVANAIALESNDYLVKSNWTLEEVAEKVKEKLRV